MSSFNWIDKVMEEVREGEKDGECGGGAWTLDIQSRLADPGE
jgi:hypothetical protein